MKTFHHQLLAAALLSLCAVGCGDKATSISTGKPPPPPDRGQVVPVADAGVDSGPPKQAFREDDFVETERSRDPFRSFAKQFVEETKTTEIKQIKVILEQYAVDDLKLIGVVTGTTEPRAMLLDAERKGWIVKRGQYIGKAEVVHSASAKGVDYELHWRIDRIRPSDIVLVREDPAHPDIPPATRVVPLRSQKEEDEEVAEVEPEPTTPPSPSLPPPSSTR